MLRTATTTLASAAIFLAITMAPAHAGGYDHGRYHGRGHHGHHYKSYGHHGHKRHYRRGHHRPRYRRHYRHDDDDDLVAGLIIGGLLGYAISSHQARDRYQPPPAYRAPPPRTAYPPAPPVVRRPPGCLQEREYQTTVMVGGKEVEAYGTACLQPDGSWRRGPAKLVDY